VWISFIPIFIATGGNQLPTRVFALCAAPALNASIALLCMLGPPVYVALVRPHKNTKATVCSSFPAVVPFDWPYLIFVQVLGKRHVKSPDSSCEVGAGRSVRLYEIDVVDAKQSVLHNEAVVVVIWEFLVYPVLISRSSPSLCYRQCLATSINHPNQTRVRYSIKPCTQTRESTHFSHRHIIHCDSSCTG
jgi:hypothetical protein